MAKQWSSSGATSRLREWAAKNGWQERTMAYDDHVDEIQRARNEEAIVEMTARHAEYALQVQEKAIEALQGVNPGDLKPHELIKWLEIAVKIERLSRGVSTENIRQEQEFKEVRDDITAEALKNPETRKIASRLIKQLADSKVSANRVSADSD